MPPATAPMPAPTAAPTGPPTTAPPTAPAAAPLAAPPPDWAWAPIGMARRARAAPAARIPFRIVNSCVVPESRGALSRDEEDALWQEFYTAAPAQRRVFEPSSKRRKKRPASSLPATD